MKKGTHIYISLLLTVIMGACGGTSHQPNAIVQDGLTYLQLDNMEGEGTEKLPMTNCKVISLEAKKGSLIGEVSKLMYKKGRYHVLDRSVVKGVLVFDDQGKFLYKIRKRGRGPGEYAECYDMELDDEGNIYILDVNSRKIIKYDPNGRFSEEYPYSFFSTAFSKVAKDTFAMYQFQGVNAEEATHFDLMYWTTKQHLTKRYFPYEPKTGAREKLSFQNFYKSPVSTLFNNTFSDTVYDVTNAGLKAKYVLDFGNHAPPTQEVKGKKFEELVEIFANNSYAWKQANFFESNDKFLGSFSLNGNIGFFKYDKGTKQVAKYYAKGMKWPDFWTAMPMGLIDQKTYYGCLNRDQIRFIKDNYDIERDELIKTVHENIPSLNKDDVVNPYIITYNINA